jgi:hypothetical protein
MPCTHKNSDYFGLDGDAFNQVPQNVSTVIDLLEDKGISWGMYQEDMPYSGFQGLAWVNQQNGANDYVRKHKCVDSSVRALFRLTIRQPRNLV